MLALRMRHSWQNKVASIRIELCNITKLVFYLRQHTLISDDKHPTSVTNIMYVSNRMNTILLVIIGGDWGRSRIPSFVTEEDRGHIQQQSLAHKES